MAITLYGVDPSIDEAHWAKLLAILGRCGSDQMVDTGLVPSAAAGTRNISVTAGDAVASGVLAESSASVTVQLNANAGSVNRIDYIVLQIDWSGSSTTGGTLTKVTGAGTGSQPPALTQTAGTLWQIPLARVTVAPGATTLSAGNVEVCRPLRQRSKASTQTVTSRALNKNNSNILCETLEITDPGWSYRIVVSGWVELASAADGHTNFTARVGGVDVAFGRSSSQNLGPAVIASKASDVLTGASTVTLLATPQSASVNPAIQDGSLNVLVLPA